MPDMIGQRRFVLGLGSLSAVLFLTLAVSSFDRFHFASQDRTELESSDMKTIDKMLSHIHSLTNNYKPESGAKTHHSKHSSSSSSSSSHPQHHLAAALKHMHSKKAKAVKHHHDEDSSGKHESKALKEAQSATASLKNSDTGTKADSDKDKKKKALIAAKMKALQAKINADFSSVMKQGKKAGYLPPVKMPHM